MASSIQTIKAMEISKILTADILDIVFEGKNKEYGAYELRKSYNGRLRMSIAVMSSVVLLLTAGFLFADNGKMILAQTFEIPDGPVLENLPDEPEPPVVPPPPVKQPDVMERRNLEIVVVPDDKVKPDEMPPPNDEFENAKISLVNKEGSHYDEVAPPVAESVGKGIIEPPKKANPDSVFMKVEIESRYPGGTEAWRRFLIKDLSNNYPQEAADQGIQGKVIVTFIVDKAGNLSNVHAVAGPKELYELAEKVIKKSGKWEPAQQNGQIVNSHKSQPIVFALDGQQ
jgi:periplasmic protein TonB